MPRVLKLAAAAAGAALIAAAAFLLHPRSRFRVSRSDDGLADRVQAALAGGFENGITVRASRGVVTLRGEVDEIADITRLEVAVRDVSGVADVDNLLRLRVHTGLRPRVLTA